jgi:hypothetical protein
VVSLFKEECKLRVFENRVLRIYTKYIQHFLVGKPEGKRPLGRQRHRWNIILK